jgi:hypothetical protein
MNPSAIQGAINLLNRTIEPSFADNELISVNDTISFSLKNHLKLNKVKKLSFLFFKIQNYNLKNEAFNFENMKKYFNVRS